jgi:hypothetical protein
VFPPKLAARTAHSAGARTQILVDDRKLSVLGAGFQSKSFSYLHDGADLAGAIMVGDPTRDYIAQRAQIPVSAIKFSAPQFATDRPSSRRQQPAPYALTVAARPTVPILDVYAVAPTVAAARRLVNASVQGLRDYLAQPGNFGLAVTQLGGGTEVAARGGGTLRGVLESFLGVLVLGCIGTLLLDRMRRAWRVGDHAAEFASTPAPEARAPLPELVPEDFSQRHESGAVAP